MIFISYRISDSNELVVHLDRDLTREFGEAAVFRDKTRIEGGTKWTTVIEENATTRPIMLVVIGPAWQTASFASGKQKGFPRLSDPEDWVRREITIGLQTNKIVIPVLLNGTSIPEREWLANFKIEALADQQSVILRSDDYDNDLNELIALVRSKCPELQRLTEVPGLSGGKIVSLPYPSLGMLFKGRDSFIADLKKSFQHATAGRATAIVGKALHGLGGVGKTRLAVEYAWQHAEDYTALLFITASTPADLRRNLAELADPLVLNLPEKEVKEEDVKFAATLRWLHGHPGWLLIVDNVDDDKSGHAVEDLLAKLQGGHVLITSRLANWSACVEPLELDVLDRSAAVQFLMERTHNRRKKQPTDDEDANELAQDLDGLALALEQAGAYIAEQRLSFAEYGAAWRAHEPGVQGWHNERQMKYPRSVAVTWQTTIAQLSVGEVALLRLFAWFAPDPIPEFVLDGDEAEKIWKEGCELYRKEVLDAKAETRIRDSLVGLATYSMIRWNVDEKTIAVHRVVQEILRNRMPEDAQRQCLTDSLKLLDGGAPDPRETVNWPRWDGLTAHVAATTHHGAEFKIGEPTASLMENLGLHLLTRARFAEAEPFLRGALFIGEQWPGPEHPVLASRLSNLASLLQETNRLVEAEPVRRRALAIVEKNCPAEDPAIALMFGNLGQLLLEMNRTVEAEELMLRALAIDEKLAPPNADHLGKAINNLAQLYRATKRFPEAETQMRRALGLFETSLGKAHPNVAIALNNLAKLLMQIGRNAEAEPLMGRALLITEQNYGPDHPRVATLYKNMGQLLQALNRIGEAETHLNHALSIDEKFGLNHPYVARDLNDLAVLFEDSNRHKEAEPLIRRALRIREECLGLEDPDVAESLHNLARLLYETDRWAEAEPLSHRSCRIYLAFTRSNGHEHPNLRTAMTGFVAILKAKRRSKKAIQRALKSLLDEYGVTLE